MEQETDDHESFVALQLLSVDGQLPYSGSMGPAMLWVARALLRLTSDPASHWWTTPQTEHSSEHSSELSSEAPKLKRAVPPPNNPVVIKQTF